MKLKTPFKNKKESNYTSYLDEDIEDEILSDDTLDNRDREDLDILFAQHLSQNNIKFVYNHSEEELLYNINTFVRVNELGKAFVWEEDLVAWFQRAYTQVDFPIERGLREARVAISRCESGIAEEGNILINANQNFFRPNDVFPQKQIILITKDQIQRNLSEAVQVFGSRTSLLPFIINFSPEEKQVRIVENKTVINSKGTKEIIVFYIEESIFG